MVGTNSSARCCSSEIILVGNSLLPWGFPVENAVFECQMRLLSGELLMILVVPRGRAAEHLFFESSHLNLSFNDSSNYNADKARNSWKMVAALVSSLSLDVEDSLKIDASKQRSELESENCPR